MVGYIIAIVIIVLVGNVIVLYSRNRKNRNEIRVSKEDRREANQWHTELAISFDREQRAAEEYVERRNKTLALYEIVRRDAENKQQPATTAVGGDSNAD